MRRARKKLWEEVFSNNWNSTKTFFEPGPVAPRTAAESTVMIGTLDEDAAVSKKRKADGTMVEGDSKPWRSAGAAVFIKVNTIWEQSDLTFPFCDARGGNFATNIKFTWTQGMDSSQAKADCTMKWDRSELSRVGKINTDWVVYWVRSKLLHGLKYGLNGRLALGDGQPNPVAEGGQRTMDINRAVDPKKIQHIRLCADV
ncbi:hypothetical protein CTA2_6743 [Colletotrichum tanaceti]|uniref:Uncharacterized protein n=1 Tax=Colletotrichum tanaceti TaxID=1306861 RepID=A0A4U6XKI8_9PEZI|nr:hypothetical protein CTA2_6724 [Colletotrichum tanaceti]KAJ0168390.1 hypothetical protein CTA2_6743 [Colletotrichum tanaceti]TKW55387.1 hypothetical protein CTA1_4069 [Colletotrichum tanaceti]